MYLHVGFDFHLHRQDRDEHDDPFGIPEHRPTFSLPVQIKELGFIKKFKELITSRNIEFYYYLISGSYCKISSPTPQKSKFESKNIMTSPKKYSGIVCYI